ncbi:golgin-45 [Caerostris extrusa]|uniref:Golgin-45 n=1 Tax=Caerostris extrusa TaxID=172846 RepID=A0AAV4YDQ7_CAEEX|nr:golgin-45 [Caerostris extrusa]
MEDNAKTCLKCPGRSQGDGMENTFRPEHEAIHAFQPPHNYFHKNFVPSHGKVKEPKFVPYEPYRAAVAPMVSSSFHYKLNIDPETVNSLATSVIQLYSDSEGKGFEINNSAKVKALEEKVTSLEKENKELSTQYQILAEVNADLKKLLVASLGEDIETKVLFMMQDKAQLGREVLRLAAELERVGEEAHQLSAHSHLWEGKFKACSVLVQDLAEQKADLSLQLGNSKEVIQSMLREHGAIFEDLCSAYSDLQSVAAAFNPSSKSAHAMSADLHVLGKRLKSLSIDLKERLLGKSTESGLPFKHVRQFTKSENEAYRLLQGAKQTSRKGDMSLCSPGRVACQVLPHACNHHLDFCKHCSGEVQNL